MASKSTPEDKPHPPAVSEAAPNPTDRPPNWPEPPARTIVEEQRERSAQIERDGTEKWKLERDERGPDDKPKQVPGMNPAAGAEPGSWEGSSRSTPEARAAQKRAAP